MSSAIETSYFRCHCQTKPLLRFDLPRLELSHCLIDARYCAYQRCPSATKAGLVVCPYAFRSEAVWPFSASNLCPSANSEHIQLGLHLHLRGAIPLLYSCQCPLSSLRHSPGKL